MANRPIGVSQMAATLVAMNQFRTPITTLPASPSVSNQIFNANIGAAQTISQSPILSQVNLLNNPPRVPSPCILEDEEELPESPRHLLIDSMQLVMEIEKSKARRNAYFERDIIKLQRMEKVRTGPYSFESAKTPGLLALKKRVARIEPREVLRLDTIVRNESKALTPDVSHICGLISSFSLDPISAAGLAANAPPTPTLIAPVQSTPVQSAPIQTTLVQVTAVQVTPVQNTPVTPAPIKNAPVVKSPPRRRGVNTNPLILYHRCVSAGLKRLSARVGVPLVASIAISSSAFRAVSASSHLGSTKLEVSRISTTPDPGSWFNISNYAVVHNDTPSGHSFS